MPNLLERVASTYTQSSQGNLLERTAHQYNTTKQAQGLVSRFGSQFYNQMVPAVVAGSLSEAKKMSMGWPIVRGKKLEEAMQEEAEFKRQFDIDALSGKYGEREKKSAQDRQVKYAEWKEKGGPPEMRLLPVPEAETFMQKGVDIAATLTAFTAQIALLRKAMPGQSDAVLWEMQNQMTGGTPGHGAAMYGLFSVPGKVIKGVGKAAKAGRLATESTLLGSVTAIEQKLTTGEINWEDVAVAAGIPVALRSLGYVKAKIRNRDPKMMEALNKYWPTPAKSKGQVTVAMPELLEKLPGQRTAAAISPQARIGARKRWARYAKQLGKTKAKVRSANVIETEIQNRLKQVDEVYTRPIKNKQAELERITTEINILDNELSNIRSGIAGKKLKNLKQLAKKQGLEVPKEAGRNEVINLLENGPKTQKRKLKGLEPTLVEAQPETIPTVKGQEPELGVGRVSTKKIIHELFDSTDAKLAVAKLTEFTKEFKEVGLKERDVAVSKLRGRQAAGGKRTLKTEWKKAVKAKGGYFAAGMKVFKGFIGKAETPEYEPPKLTDPQWDILTRRAKHIYTGPQIESLGGKVAKRGIFRFANTIEAIGKLRKGFVPTLYEWALLEPVLGTKLTGELHNALSTKQTSNLWRTAQTTRDAFKVLKLGYDIQPFRQTSTISTRHPVITWKARGRSLIAFGSALSKRRKYIEKIKETHNRDPRTQMFIDEYGSNYLSGQKWASVEAGTKLQEYGQFPEWLLASKRRPLRLLGHFIKSMEEATEVGVNSAMDMLNVNAESHLSTLRASGSKYAPKTDAEVAEWRRLRGRAHNAFLKRIVARTPEGKKIQAAANLILISPAHFVSRPVGTYEAVVSPFRKFGNIRTRTYAAQVIGLNLIKTTAMGSLLAYVKAKYLANDPSKEPLIDGSPDPSNNLYGKARVSGSVIDLTGGDATDYRDFARLMLTAYAYAKQKATGKIVTEVGGYKVRPAWSIIKQHMISREALHLGIAQSLLSGKDWLGRPVPRWKSFLQIFTPSQLDSMIERFQADGTLDALQTGDVSQVAKDTIRAATVGIIEETGANIMSYPVPAYQREQAFLDDASKKRFGMEWDYLTPLQQIQIRNDNRDILQTLANQKASESVENPYTGKSAEERQRESGEFLRGKLSKPVKKILKSIDIRIPRTFNKFRLNDERFNRYIDLVVEELNERIPTVQLEGLSESTQREVLKAYVAMSKKMAYSRLMQELMK